ncbi:non-heme iron oxygenase ferredoxin subunit [Candidatus Poriferisodalis sp.]|uniref:non-heme iron oxygenase ferredoxin subunit n=1 Tax=Candidatus Poriferisodalis sp. TaxID=3101277 RepID=UPI003B014E45
MSTAGGARTVVLCQRDDVPDGEARRFDVEGHRIALARIDDDFYAIGDQCSHQNYSLADGWVWPDECALECPQHSSSFDLRTGRPNCFPATQPVPVYEIRTQDDGVAVVLP